MATNSVYLEVDSSITEKQLRLINDDDTDEFQKYLAKNEGEYPSKFVTPFPGFCVKSKDVMGDKFFVNICHCDMIPVPPSNFTSLDAEDVLEHHSEQFRVPMSIGQVRLEVDAKGDQCNVCDVLINSTFFKQIEDNAGWRHFLLTIIFEAIKEKYQVDCMDQTKIILHNRKHLGTLQRHQIQDRDTARKMGIVDLPGLGEANKPKIETISSTNFETRCPEYRLYKKKERQTCLVGEFKLPDVVSASELKLDIGEDRIIIECEQRNYLLDIFVPVVLRAPSSTSVFDKATKILTVTMPLIGG